MLSDRTKQEGQRQRVGCNIKLLLCCWDIAVGNKTCCASRVQTLEIQGLLWSICCQQSFPKTLQQIGSYRNKALQRPSQDATPCHPSPKTSCIIWLLHLTCRNLPHINSLQNSFLCIPMNEFPSKPPKIDNNVINSFNVWWMWLFRSPAQVFWVFVVILFCFFPPSAGNTGWTCTFKPSQNSQHWGCRDADWPIAKQVARKVISGMENISSRKSLMLSVFIQFSQSPLNIDANKCPQFMKTRLFLEARQKMIKIATTKSNLLGAQFRITKGHGWRPHSGTSEHSPSQFSKWQDFDSIH